MKGKAVQGATDSMGDDERGYIQSQVDSLMDQINDIVDSTEFQGDKLLSGAYASGGSGGGLSSQVGAGTGSANTIDVSINDMHANELGLSSMGGSGQSNFQTLISNVDSAIKNLSSSFNQIGIDQKSLSIRQDTLQQAITSNKSARSSIQDADFAKLESQSIKLQIKQQTAISAFAQANASPQAVLKFL
jgi:flagellin